MRRLVNDIITLIARGGQAEVDEILTTITRLVSLLLMAVLTFPKSFQLKYSTICFI